MQWAKGGILILSKNKHQTIQVTMCDESFWVKSFGIYIYIYIYICLLILEIDEKSDILSVELYIISF